MPDSDSPPCPMCSNGEGQFLGILGASAKFRCRDCGWEWSEDAYPEPDEAQEWADFDPDC